MTQHHTLSLSVGHQVATDALTIPVCVLSRVNVT